MKEFELPRPQETPKAPVEKPPVRAHFIERMPDRETLEAFMIGLMGGGTKVLFDRNAGSFKWVVERELVEVEEMDQLVYD